MGRENIWDIERTLRNIKPEVLRAMAQMNTPGVLRAMEILGSPTWRYAQDVIKSYNKLFHSRAEARLLPSCTEAETERPLSLQRACCWKKQKKPVPPRT